MSIFNLITLLGGLAMFLYGMRMMGDGLKESSSGTLKRAMEKLTSTPIRAFLLGLGMTAVIQSSTATIVITSGLVGAGILSLHQSLGIIVGANVGTTVTGQIIRLLDIDNGAASFLQFFKPSTLAPLALIIGIVIIMGRKFKGSDTLGKIAIGFGILFTGLMNMTGAVESLQETGIYDSLFSQLGDNPLIGYLIGAAVAFVLQSSSAAIGILQAFSTSGMLTFSAIYAVLVGIYLGDCVTTAIVINIGGKPDARRVGYVNIIFNLCKSAAILIVVGILHSMGILDGFWSAPINSGGIANANSIFNLACAIALFPLLPLYEKLSYKLVKDKSESPASAKASGVDSLNPVFFSSPALAFGSCYDLLLEMYTLARQNISRGFGLINSYNEEIAQQINTDEDTIDMMADRLSNYLSQLAGHISSQEHAEILNNYYAVTTEFERLGDHATNLMEIAASMKDTATVFSASAQGELAVVQELIDTVLDHTENAFRNRDLTAARHIEPLEEVVDDMVGTLKHNHLQRLKEGTCSVYAGTEFLNTLSEVERISDICSNVGVSVIVRIRPEIQPQIHNYISMLHSGRDETFNREYKRAHDRYFRLLGTASQQENSAEN